jgi:carbonic anhydrase
MTGKYQLFAQLKADLPAGIAVFLIAIPLSLGIALASGAPLFSGLITGIIGGLVVAPLSGSALGISGTAAGLAVLVLTGIEQLGFNVFLLVVVIAGLLQILMGLVKAGVIGYYFPSSVINGMLSGIGIIVFLKQIPHAIGYDSDYEGDMSFFQTDSYSSFSELQHMLSFISPTATLITAFSLVVLIAWEWLSETKPRVFQPIHGILLSVLSGVAINQLIRQVMPDMALRESHLVALPVLRSVADFSEQLHFPDFSALSNPNVYLAAMTLAIVASLETLLSVEAVDKLDADKRTTPTNRELLAQGVGNICSGMIGGLPLTQVIVRSSLNVQAGARSKCSAITHGVLLLLTTICIPQWLNEIPLASLAAILLVVSFKLTKPDIVVSMFRAGWYHFLPYVATVLGLVLTDMLTGIVIGLSTALFAILLENYKSAEYFQAMRLGNKTILRLAEHVSFLNKANIQQTLKKLPMFSEVVIDASRCKYMDYDVYEIIRDFQRDAEVRRIKLTLNNFRGHGELPPITNARPPSYDAQNSLTPNDVLTLLKEGNLRFVNNLEANRNFLEQVNDRGSFLSPLF